MTPLALRLAWWLALASDALCRWVEKRAVAPESNPGRIVELGEAEYRQHVELLPLRQALAALPGGPKHGRISVTRLEA